jgi:uncharacterized membrane protein YvlD (DUF360 family)
MKKIVRIFSREVVALYIITQVASGIVFENYLQGLLITGVALAIATYIVKPIVNMLLLPINLATLGLFKFLSHAITLFIVDVALTQFSVTGFHFAGLHAQYLDLPAVNFGSGPFAYIAYSLLLMLITSLLG